MSTTYLPDTSAWHRSGATAPVRERWDDLVLGGSIAIAPPVRLELLYSARDPDDYLSLSDDLTGLLELPCDSAAATRACEIQAALARASQHRGPTPVDLLIAAIAELNEAVLLHYDRHFDTIAGVTDLKAEWLVPRGALD